MDNRSIFSKTGKGSLEIAKKTLKLSSEERQTLILVDGKSNYADLQEKLSRIQPVKLRAVFERLLELGLIREFVGKSNAPEASGAAPRAAQPVIELIDSGEELDFTSLVPAASVANNIAALRQAAAAADQPANQPPADDPDGAALRDALAQSFAAEAAGTPSPEEAARATREEAMRKVQAHKAAQAEAARVAAANAEAARVAAAEADAEAARARAAEEQARVAAEKAAELAAKQAAEQAAKQAAAQAAEQTRAAAEQAVEQARIKAEADRLAAEQRAREEKERQEREETARLAAEEEARRKAETDARIKAEAERMVREQRAIQEKERQEREAAARAAAEEEARVKAEAERVAREQREREEAERRAAEEEAKGKAEEEARLKAEAERLAREQREREEAERRAAEEEARRKAEEEARIKAEAERLAREQLEREEAARRAAEEEAKRKAEEEARIKAEAERLAREQLEREAKEQREREEAAQRAAEEEARQKAEAARRAAEEEARIKAEAERMAREQMEREDQERREREEVPKRAEEEAARRAAEEEARNTEEAARVKAEEEARRKAEEDARLKAEAKAQKKAEAERQAQQAREREEKERADRERAERERADRERAERERADRERAERERADRERTEREAAEKQAAAATAAAAASAAALLAQQAAATPAAAPAADGSDLEFAPGSDEQRRKDEVAKLLAGATALRPDGTTPLTGGGPDTFANTGPEFDPFADDSPKPGKEQELASRREIEQEARDRASARAEPADTPEHHAEPAHEPALAKVRRSGGGLPLGKITGAVAALVLVGAIGYVFMMPVDKPGIERALSERLGEAVTVDAAKVSPFSAALTLTGVNIGPLKLASVAASTDFSALFSSQKIWKSVDITGLSIDAAAARSLIALGARDVPKTAAGKVQIQRLHITDMDISGLPVAAPKFNVDILFTSSGTLKLITLATADDKARAILQPEEKGWLVNIESKGMIWPAGPKIAWESVRAKGIGSANGIKFEDYTIGHFGGVSRGAGELSWNNGWKFNGNLDAGAIESEAIAQAFYDATPVSGTIEGKLSIAMSSPSLARLFETPQIDGALSVSKAILKTVDLARTAQTGATAQGSTRFTDFSTTLAVAGGRVQLKDIKGVSGLLTVSGNAQLDAAKNVSGGLLVELGVGGSRAKANVKLSGTMAEPKLAK